MFTHLLLERQMFVNLQTDRLSLLSAPAALHAAGFLRHFVGPDVTADPALPPPSLHTAEE